MGKEKDLNIGFPASQKKRIVGQIVTIHQDLLYTFTTELVKQDTKDSTAVTGKNNEQDPKK